MKGLEPTQTLKTFERDGLVRREARPLSVGDERLIDEGIDAVMRLPPPARSMGALREMLGYDDAEGIGARLERWCQGHALG